jgi:hypothetical protein
MTVTLISTMNDCNSNQYNANELNNEAKSLK